MDWQLITILAMFIGAILYIATLYHLAHGRERKAMETGARIVMDALTRDGRLMPDEVQPEKAEPVHLGEEDFTHQVDTDGNPLPDIIVARNERAAAQIGERIMADILETANASKKV